MTELRSEFLRTIVDRQFFHQCTDLEGLDEITRSGPISGYIGFDCTAPSLHVGSLVQILWLRNLQRAGHKPIVLMGGGTTLIGDPSGRDESRKLLTADDIATNMASIKKVFAKFLTFGDGPTDAIMVDNADWLNNLQYIPFLRDFGRHFSINRMLGFDSVKLRLDREQSLSFLEFNYMILQAYDFVELYKRYGCVLQLGGSDQWGNIVNGVELARRVEGASLFGLTSPLITTASGGKMGKTAKGAVWLNEDMCSPYDYWQFWRNTDDADVGRFLSLFTDLPLDEVRRLAALEGSELNEAKKILANEATAMCHGEQAARDAGETARRTFEEGAAGDKLPTIDMPRSELEPGVAAYLLFRRADLCASNGEARRLIRGGGARINGEKVASEEATVTLADVGENGLIKLSAGRKRHALIRPV
ncbi:MAG: tyrosine--tRNA ligase [Sphingomonadales bacterium]